ncbi:MAG: Formamidopyrimidine-DNA glycosylase [uncultured Nocardioidaceae bacterium]|uniref:Formamidopyrimidine-DNA glycosylase n=1 Tax=uncultured Nocardioidaceae bacterium TaxID=253824 RepID=A0A6J4MN83_9ACTN|nr:MAG: Formamidopyrimidine-DNA glycosylase [uncultured Nocardioidaceae bacterium]
MPELPEVETVRAGLAEHVVGRTITAVDVLHPRPVRRHAAGAEDFAARLTGRRICDARRRGKYLWLPLDDGDAILAHLGMSGQLLVAPADLPDQRHLRVRLTLGDGQVAPSRCEPSPLELRFADQRMFGGLSISPAGAELPPEIAHIARDPIDPEFDDALFVARLRQRTSALKRLLLDQRLVSGIGNIYADEALWLAMLHGERPSHRLRRSQAVEVLAAVRTVLAASLAQGGTSFDALYVNVNGESGYFERSLEVYGREGEPCRRCGTAIVRVPFMNRSSFYCPTCQPRPRRRTS